MKKEMKHLQYWIDSNVDFYLMKDANGELIVVPGDLRELALRQDKIDAGPEDEFGAVEITKSEADRLGLN